MSNNKHNLVDEFEAAERSATVVGFIGFAVALALVLASCWLLSWVLP